MCDWARASYRPRLHTSNHVVVHVFTRRIKGQGIQHYFKILLDGQTLRSEPFSPLRGNSISFCLSPTPFRTTASDGREVRRLA